MGTVAEMLYERGKKDGIEKGREEGVQEGIRKGIQKGRVEALREAIADLLEVKFGQEGLALAKRAQGLDSIEVLEELRVWIKRAKSLDEVASVLSRLAPD